jgi:hypothetical protein
MSAQHTPGPWTVNKTAALINAPDSESICLLRWPTTVRTEVETKANATLIAAAPDLLDALETLNLVIGLTPIKGNLEALQEACDHAREAIKKAKGELQ